MDHRRMQVSLMGCALAAALLLGTLPVSAAGASPGSNLVGAPTVVARLENKEQLADLAAEPPASLIITVDADGNAVGADGQNLGTFLQVYADVRQADVIPIAQIADAAAAEAFVSLWDSIGNADMAVMSADAQVLFSVRSTLTELRGIYDCSDMDLADDAARYDAVARSTQSMANVVVIGGEQASVETVAYLQGRFKTVWAELDAGEEGEDFAVHDIVSSGAYGIVCTDSAAVYRALRQYPQGALARIARNIAHRGLPMSMAENSIAGALAAAEGGAPHIEIDVHLTADGEVVVMHDDTIDRTTDGTGAVSAMTLEQLRRYHIVRTYGAQTVDPEPIPTLGDFFAAFDGTGIVIVCEIKTSDTAVLQAMLPVIEAYDFWDQLVFISFDLDILAAAHEQLPQVPTASLATFPARLFSLRSAQYNRINTVVDAAYGELSNEDYYDGTMKDRGYMSYVWTYDTAQDCVLAMSYGLYGLTNNDAAAFGKNIGALAGQAGQTMRLLDYDIPVNVVVQTYAGEEAVREGTVFSWRDCGTYAEVIAAYSDGECVLFTPAFRVDYVAPAPSGMGTGWVVGLSVAGGAVILAGAAVVIVLLRKRRHSIKKDG